MKYFALVWAGLFRKKARTLLTLASLFIAFMLFGLLQAVNHAFESGVSISGAGRLITNGRYSIIDNLPISHVQRIRSLQSVASVTHASWFGGTYQDPANFFAKFPVEPEQYLAMYPELSLSEAQKQAFIDNRTATIVSRSLAERFNWKIGDRIPIVADIWPGKNGNTWEFELVGIYDIAKDSNYADALLFRYDYFDENRVFGQGLVGWIITRLSDPNKSAEVAAAIDQMFLNSNNETKTATEQDFLLSFAKQVGNIGLIVTGILGAVFFTILLVTGNTMSQTVRERIPELAVLKTIGFTNHGILGLILSESVLMTLIGGGLGLLTAMLVVPGAADALRSLLPGMFLTYSSVLYGMLLALFLGVFVGAIPAIKAMRLNIVDALGEK